MKQGVSTGLSWKCLWKVSCFHELKYVQKIFYKQMDLAEDNLFQNFQSTQAYFKLWPQLQEFRCRLLHWQNSHRKKCFLAIFQLYCSEFYQWSRHHIGILQDMRLRFCRPLIFSAQILTFPPVLLHLILEKSSLKNQIWRIEYFVYFELDFYCLCSLQKFS